MKALPELSEDDDDALCEEPPTVSPTPLEIDAIVPEVGARSVVASSASWACWSARSALWTAAEADSTLWVEPCEDEPLPFDEPPPPLEEPPPERPLPLGDAVGVGASRWPAGLRRRAAWRSRTVSLSPTA